MNAIDPSFARDRLSMYRRAMDYRSDGRTFLACQTLREAVAPIVGLPEVSPGREHWWWATYLPAAEEVYVALVAACKNEPVTIQFLESLFPFYSWTESTNENRTQSMWGTDSYGVCRMEVCLFSETGLYPGEVSVMVKQDSIFGGGELLTASQHYTSSAEAFDGLLAIAPKLQRSACPND